MNEQINRFRITDQDHRHGPRHLHDEEILRQLHVLLAHTKGEQRTRGRYGCKWHELGGRWLATK